MKEVSVVIPCLNEAKTIGSVVEAAINGLKAAGCDGEVIVSDNGSTDGSIETAKHRGARVVCCTKRGYGSALHCGFSAAEGKYIIFGDADGSYDFSRLSHFIRFLREGYDMVIGTRIRGRIERGAMPRLHRYLGTPVLSFLLNLLFGTRISDCNCGMRGLSKRAFEQLHLQSAGMEFASEMVIKTGMLRMRIKEVPIVFYRDKRGRHPHLNTWRDGWRHLRLILIFAPDHLFIYPGSALFLVGAFLVLVQLRGPVTIGAVHMDLHFMILGLTFSLLGISIFQMGMIIKLFSGQNNYYDDDLLVRKLKSISFEKKILFGALSAIMGAGIDMKIFLDWVRIDFANPEMLRNAVLGLYFVFMGVSLILFFFLEAVMNNGRERSK